MLALMEFAERTDVRALIETLLQNHPDIEGIVVDYDDFWFRLWRLRCRIGDYHLRQRIEFGLHAPDVAWESFLFSSDPCIESVAEIPPPDPKWRPPHWDKLMGVGAAYPSYGDEPLVVRVCIPIDAESPEWYEFTSGIRIVIERHSPVVLLSPRVAHRPLVGGISMGQAPRSSATLGGIVRDSGGQTYALTCAHAVDGAEPAFQPSLTDDKNAAKIGVPAFKSPLVPSGGAPCNPYAPGAVLTGLDAALIPVAPADASAGEVLGLGPLTGWVPRVSLEPGQLVEVAGKESGLKTLEVGGLAVLYKTYDATTKTYYCYRDLFQLRWPSIWRTCARMPVQRGDSGAWVVTNDGAGRRWAGMVVAGDRLLGYAQFAEDVVDWAKSAHGLTLSL